MTHVEGGETPSAAQEAKPFVATPESKAKAKKLRIFSILSWIVAIGLEVGAILMLKKVPIQTTWLIVLIVADLIFAVIGNLLWKKANRFDPASEKEKFKFFVQNQLGAIIAVIALLIAGFTGIDFNPPSQEQYAAQTAHVERLTGQNHVFWTKSGTKYPLFSDCYHINTKKTNEIFEGTVAQARELKNISELCNTCENRWKKEKALPAETTTPEVEEEQTE
ncbi:MAG: hypothetical protein KJ808_02950 [Acidobacteria bacterium]|nr:hypothetical protein [Acidobacteriota bacterium]MBU4306618.1 hypothetical protein [Acidobacteriota bacterium]MBU4404980.1 hypothetical protein [Acidobacteriota bacterium]MCG2810278.1 hypothetical protein [Candidatus Aminicenantes bacterium]